MPNTIPACPQCGLENTYPDADNYVCPDCAHEWPQLATSDSDSPNPSITTDARSSGPCANRIPGW